ncbi:hypothetical protein D9M69_371540 [compost metagenome]
MPGQRRDVLAAVGQAWDVDADDVQAMEQVLAEFALAHQVFQVLVGGGDDPHVDLHRRVPADPVELAVGQHAQQAGLGVGRHVADLVEEQGAAVGLLEASAALRGGTGEGALLVAEQFGFHQVLGNRRHVQRDERLGRARAVAVQGVGDQFLAGAGFAVDQHGDVGMAEASDGAEHLLHGRRLADDLRGARQCGRRFQGLLFLGVLVGALDQGDRLVDVERLGQVFEGAALVGRHRAVQVGMRGHDDHRQARVHLADLRQQVEAAGAGHADVGDDHVRLLAAEAAEHAVGVVEAERGHAFLLQRFLQYPADGAVVVDDPDGL